MNIWRLLTYDIREHNEIWFRLPCNNRHDGFWSKLKNSLKGAFGKKTWVVLWNNLINPYYLNNYICKPVLFVPISSNNKRAMEPIWKNLDSKDYTIINPEEDEFLIPKKLVNFYSAIYLYPLLKLYFKANQLEKYIICEHFELYYQTIGFYVVAYKLLKHSHPRLIVFANDHVASTRSFIKAAHELGIQTMYVQHCSVTDKFPSLSFTYNFLDGEESLLKYITREMPKQGKIYLVGNPRFDIINKYCQMAPNQKRIGIALNSMDNEDVWKALCELLISKGYKDITVRPHPGDIIDSNWYLRRHIKFSDSNTENPFQFIARLDYILAGDCGIHLDAALMNRISICYNSTNEPSLDWYSYIANGLVQHADRAEELIYLLHQNNELQLTKINGLLPWYCASYTTPHNGHIGEMLAEFIRATLKNNIENFDKCHHLKLTKKFGYPVYVYSQYT